MNPTVTGATVRRILQQLHHDPRTIGMMLAVPVLLMTLLYFMFDSPDGAAGPSGAPAAAVLDRLLLVMLGIFPFIIMFLVTSIAMLRERTTGTLERLMTTRIGKGDLLGGYGVAFGSAAAVQALVAAGCAYWLFGLDTAGSPALVVGIAVLTALLGVGLGLTASALARTEFQAVQMLPVVVIPQILLCGLFVPREQMAGWLQAVSDVLPLSYAVEALKEVGSQPTATGVFWRDVAVVGGCVILALVVAAATLRRRTA